MSLIGPTLRRSTRFGADPGRVLVDRDTNALTFADAPAPLLRDLDYQIAGTAPRETSSTSGAKGLLWLKQMVVLFGATGGVGGPYLLGAGWTGDEPAGRFQGYLLELTAEPGPGGGDAADLVGFTATITVRDVRVTDGSNGSGPLTGTLHMQIEPQE